MRTTAATTTARVASARTLHGSSNWHAHSYKLPVHQCPPLLRCSSGHLLMFSSDLCVTSGHELLPIKWGRWPASSGCRQQCPANCILLCAILSSSGCQSWASALSSCYWVLPFAFWCKSHLMTIPKLGLVSGPHTHIEWFHCSQEEAQFGFPRHRLSGDIHLIHGSPGKCFPDLDVSICWGHPWPQVLKITDLP